MNGQWTTCVVEPASILDIRIVDQGGLVDLNAAPVPMLQAFFSAAGVSPNTARKLAEEVADYRDTDDDPQSNGIPESAQYAEKGLPWKPRNAAFADPAEFGQLPSASSELVSRLQPMLTVYNAKASLDLDAMDRIARATLPSDVGDRLDISRWMVPSERMAFSVEARLRRTDGSTAAANRVLVTFGNGQPGAVQIRQWESGSTGIPLPPRSAATSSFCTKLMQALVTARKT